MPNDLIAKLIEGRRRQERAAAMRFPKRGKGKTFEEIGKALGVSRQRAHAMLKSFIRRASR